MSEGTAVTIDDYIAGFPAVTREALKAVRAIVREVSPDAVETISYGMPTFDLNGRHLVHFAAYAHHIGFYPVPKPPSPFEDELGRYRSGQGTARFPLGKPLPLDLIRKLTEHRVEVVSGER